MCIIVSKEKYKKIPKREILQNCFNNNPDGAGFMYTNNKKVYVEKGFMNFDDFYNRLIELDKKINLTRRSLVMHFRIGTSGKLNEATCHPFPISNKIADLQATKIECKIGMVHNGIISNFAYQKSELSDTQNYVKDFVYNLYKLNKNFLRNKYTKNILNTSCNHTKLAFLDSSDQIYYFGDFEKDESGIKYSNGTYKTTYFKTFSNYNNYYDDIDYDYYSSNKEDKTTKIYYVDVNDIAFLDDTMYYYPCTDTKVDDFIKCNYNMCIDSDYNLYEILDDFNYATDYLKVKLICTDVIVFGNDMQEITFTNLQKLNVIE